MFPWTCAILKRQHIQNTTVTMRKPSHHLSLITGVLYIHRQFWTAPKFLEVQHFFLCNCQFFHLPRLSADYTTTFHFNSLFSFHINHNSLSHARSEKQSRQVFSSSPRYQQRFSSILLPEPPPTRVRGKIFSAAHHALKNFSFQFHKGL